MENCKGSYVVSKNGDSIAVFLCLDQVQRNIREITGLVRHMLAGAGGGAQMPLAYNFPRQNSSLLLVTVPLFPPPSPPKAKCSAWKPSSFSDSLFQIKGFKLTYDHVST